MKTEAEKQKSKTSQHTFIEGWLYWYTAFGVALLEYMSSEEAYKYCNVVLLFWMKAVIGSSVGGFNAVKAFRSMTFGRAYNAPDPKTVSTSSVEVTTVTQPTEEVKPPVTVPPNNQTNQ